MSVRKITDVLVFKEKGIFKPYNFGEIFHRGRHNSVRQFSSATFSPFLRRNCESIKDFLWRRRKNIPLLISILRIESDFIASHHLFASLLNTYIPHELYLYTPVMRTRKRIRWPNICNLVRLRINSFAPNRYGRSFYVNSLIRLKRSANGYTRRSWQLALT